MPISLSVVITSPVLPFPSNAPNHLFLNIIIPYESLYYYRYHKNIIGCLQQLLLFSRQQK